jgi:hypothetical protein
MGRGLWLVDGIGGSLMPGPFYFAWAGGTIADQVTIVTTGNTHGGILQTLQIVADIEGGGQNLFNLSSNSSLEVGALYRVEGPGIPVDTHFIYDTSVLIGEPGSVNLTKVTGSDVLSGTFTLTKSMPVGQWAANVTAGATSIDFGVPLDLEPGLYSIAGDAIGICDVPLTTTTGGGSTTTTGGTAQVSVPSAMFGYAGGTSISLFVMAAKKTIVIPFDQTGQPQVYWDVVQQPVRLNATGSFAFQINGMPDQDWYSITKIPGSVLSGLIPGLRYNLSGAGIKVGSTFVAPNGGTSIEIDQAAEASAPNALITISGPRTPDAPFDPAIHDRFDEEVLSIELSQNEGDFATLDVELKTRGIGYLAVGRNLWCWLSYDPNWGGAGPPDLQPIFNGRLVGVPELRQNEIVKLQFVARPDDYTAQKLALTDSMMVLPFYDSAFLTSQSPDTVLEAYSALFHIDRTTLELTASDILQGEDGIIPVGEDEAFYDSFSMSFGQGGAPLRQVSVSATVSWTQEGEGLVDVTSLLKSAFEGVGNFTFGTFAVPPGRYASQLFNKHVIYTGGFMVSTFNGSGLKGAWPSPGTGIGGGWAVAQGSDGDGQPYSYMLDATLPGGWMEKQYYNVTYAGAAPPAQEAAPTEVSDFNIITSVFGINTYSFALNFYKIRMVLEYHASRKRTETVRAVLVSDVQDEVSDSGENDREEITLTSDTVGQGVDPGGAIPIGTPLYRSYFQTDRGAGSFEYLLLLARAKLRARARSVDVSFAVDFPTALGINLRNSVALFDRRLPGGTATGKVKHYRITVGEAGMWGEFTVGCSIGNGQLVGAAEGINSYIDDGYVDAGYQVVAGAQYMLLHDELAYQTLDQFVVIDDGLDLANVLTADQAVNFCTVTNGMTAIIDELNKFKNAVLPIRGLAENPFAATKKLKTTVTLDMKPVTGAEYHTDFLPAVSVLGMPKTIDLAAAATGESTWDATHPAGDSAWDSEQSGWDQPPALRGSNGQQHRSYQARPRQPDHGVRAG